MENRLNFLKEVALNKKETLLGKEKTLQVYKNYLDKYTKQLEYNLDMSDRNTASIAVINNIVDTRTDVVLDKLKNTIDNALSLVPLTNNYVIEILENETKRSGRELHVKLLDTEANKVRGLRTSSGTAVAQLVSFVMRIVLVGFSEHRKILLIDENFSGFQDKEAISIFGSILVALAEQEDFQIILVEHKSEFNNVEGVKNIVLERPNYKTGVRIAEINEYS